MVKVLVVDDEPRLVGNIAAYLASYPEEFEVATALSAEEGLVALASESAGVLLTDVRLPGMDGIELVRRALAAQPELRIIVMSAYGSPELRELALREGAVRFVEKPIDLEELRSLLHEVLASDQGWSGMVGGLDLFDVTQLLAMSGRSKVVRVSWEREEGVLAFKGGKLTHASSGARVGEEAFNAMALWEGGSFAALSTRDNRKYAANITLSTSQVLLEAAHLRDERRRPVTADPLASIEDQSDVNLNQDEAGIILETAVTAPPADFGAQRNDSFTEGLHMAIKDHLNELQSVSGFIAAAVFSPQGEMLEGFSNSNMDIKSVGMFANNALLNAQKATDQMGVGRGNKMQIRAPQATVVMRCLNEATDFSASAAGKAHFHSLVVMDPEGNVAMAAMILDKIVGKIADEVR